MEFLEVKKQLTEDLKNAIKSGDTAIKGAISTASAKLSDIEKQSKLKGKEVLESDIVAVFSAELKQANESLQEAIKAARQDVIDETNKKIEFIKKYLPQQLSTEEIKTEVLEKIKELGLQVEELTQKDFGKIMGKVSAAFKGRADGKEVAKIVQSLIKR